ncbi:MULTISPECIES: aspartate--tRNA(Asn) ligase [unclassified Haladaptatus]|uniref:aspartate--tRNA(Asn) ligase n=1 Tax=unclassified Haladaptatus TaxID=2622732 RepID=UPI00209BFB7A|nr:MULTISPECIES: aspartate--tRNA(Asn) ligase [unclassified Haladaptatus]MCO8245104.1 aspartate--tRNA(Asn) ligase [Haladaptatus sp. AB643]MCO8253247.1 aspartate--tRNA(Asn) ligase [Haladaptatus sp. AB618]
MIERTYSDDITTEQDGETVSIAGNVHDIRDLGGLSFVIVRDREGQIQVVFKEQNDEELFEASNDLGKEDVVRITGTVKASDQAPGGVELMPSGLEVISEADSPLPMEVAKDIESDLSTRLDNRSIDLRKPETYAVFSLRSKLVNAMEEWFDDEGFRNVDTPLLSQEGAEGGAELFPVVYYGDEVFLSQSPQLYKQMLMAAGFDKIYETGTAFRAEAFATSRHVSEISMFDVELAYIEDHHDVMDVQEESLRYTLEQVSENAADELETLGVELDVPTDPFPRVTFEEARDILATEFDHVPDDETDLDTKGEKLLGEYFAEQGHPAFFVVGYPDEKFYYKQDVPEDDIASRKFDLIYLGQELSSGGQREHDIETMSQYMEDQGADPENFHFYLESFRFGIPPHGGYGLGIDRLVQKVAGLENIKEGILFPRDPDRVTP